MFLEMASPKYTLLFFIPSIQPRGAGRRSRFRRVRQLSVGMWRASLSGCGDLRVCLVLVQLFGRETVCVGAWLPFAGRLALTVGTVAPLFFLGWPFPIGFVRPQAVIHLCPWRGDQRLRIGHRRFLAR